MTWINYQINMGSYFEAADQKLLTNKVIEDTLQQFFKDVMSKLSSDTYVMILFRMEYETNQILTLGPQQKINKHDIKELVSSYKALLEIKDEKYKNTPMNSIIISYKVIPEDKLVMKKSKIYINKLKPLSFYSFYGYDLPTTANFTLWGDVLTSTNNFFIIKKQNSNLKYIIHLLTQPGLGLINKVNLMKGDNIILSWDDIIPNKDNKETFTRKITNKSNNQEYHFENGKLIVKLIDKVTHFLSTIEIHKEINNKIITMDFESRKINNVTTPYLIAFFDGINSYSFYLDDYENVDSMLKTAFKHLLKSKYDQYKIYLHNLSYFDGVFLLNILHSLGPDTYLKILKHEGRFIDLKLSFSSSSSSSSSSSAREKNNILGLASLSLPLGMDEAILKEKNIEGNSVQDSSMVFSSNEAVDFQKKEGKRKKHYHIYFRDSLLMLPLALSKLATSFNVSSKSIFPIFAPNDLPLNYIGSVPDKQYFKDITRSEYIAYSSNTLFSKYIYDRKLNKWGWKNINWSLREESIKYCLQDCKSLYLVLIKFNDIIFDKFQLNINKFPTLSSLAFAIYRSHYLKDNKIPLITGQILDDIRQGYYGGATDMYKPKIKNNKPIYTYDVNSLYPYVMSKYPMPIGKIRFFEGDIFKIMKNPFGFFEVEITTPNDLNIPIILTRITKDGQTKTIAPLGNWKDVIFSEEMFNSMKNFGYKFKVLKGYLFDKGFVFKEYVDSLYAIKSNTPKDNPMYLISKLLLNTLYGKFGMHVDTYLTQHAIINDEELYSMIDNNIITDTLPLSDNKQLISFISYNKKDINFNLNNLDHNMNISIGLSASITAYARIHMSQFKRADNKYTLLYTDTDSIAINKPLPNNLIDPNRLGAMKLENIFQKVAYLGPKVYGGLLSTFIVDTKGNCTASVTKVKGFKDVISFNTLEDLLKTSLDNNIQSTTLEHEKWFRNWEKGEILIKEQIYTLTPTQNKRELIIQDNNIVDTKPYTINNKKEIIK